jgi:Na+:H+ antiporter, NhaA family
MNEGNHEAKNVSEPELPATPIGAVARPLQRFIDIETTGAAALLLAAATGLIIANTPISADFNAFWQTPMGLRIGTAAWDYPLRHWINDGLLTIFFFVVGLEIKREIAQGELSERGMVALPVFAALGGMLVPAAVYLSVAPGSATSGWGIVMATDTAFVLGVLSLLGQRVPSSLRAFVLALAIIDDIGAMFVIAVGYNHGFEPFAFFLATAGVGSTALMRWLGVRWVLAYWFVGGLSWVALHESGIHPTIIGVALGLLTPVTPWVDPTRLDRFLIWARRVETKAIQRTLKHKPTEVREKLARAAVESLSPEERLENVLHPWSAFLILPLFALANAGVSISATVSFNQATLAIVTGLVIGKPLGVFLFSRTAVAIRLARKPDDVTWPMLLAAGALAGIGFTISVFISQLAFDGDLLKSSKTGILVASMIAAIVGLGLMWIFAPPSED